MSRTDVLEELESLRTQVSELSRNLAGRDRMVDHLQNIVDTVPDFLFTLNDQGQLIPYNLTGAALKSSQGETIGIAGMGRDVSERKRTEAEHEALFEQSPLMCFLIDMQGRVLKVNRQGAEALGYEATELLGQSILNVFPEEHRARAASHVAACAASPSSMSMTWELEKQRKNGSRLWVKEFARVIMDRHGKPTVLISCEDITERKQVEDTLRQREQDLHRAIDERERISQDLHDGILQSLYAVGLGLESCKPLMQQRKHGKALDLLSQAIGQMNRVMDEIRSFIAGLDSRSLSGEPLSGALQAAIKAVTGTQPLHCAVAIDEAAACRLSAEQIMHLTNITREALSNSLRHGHATKASLSFTPLARSLRLCISDNGHGFDLSGMHGVGHGLANMAARARKIGGRLAIRSAPRRGTRIIVDLPQRGVL